MSSSILSDVDSSHIRYAGHLYLIHDEDNTANLTPALDPRFKPDQVTLVFDPSRQALADALSEILKVASIQVDTLTLTNDYDVEVIRERVLQYIAQSEQTQWALNLAGGSRPMCAAAHEVFRDLDLPIFFADAERDRVQWIFEPNYPRLPSPFYLANKVKLRAFFQSYLGEVLSFDEASELTKDQAKLCRELAARPQLYGSALKTLNYLASTAERTLRSAPLEHRHSRDEGVIWLIGQLENCGLLKTEVESGRLTFPNEDARFFVNGGWLEQYVQHLLIGMRGRRRSIQEIGRSVEVLWRVHGEEVKNEIDVAFLANNRLYIVECKTKHFNERSLASDTIYKLDTLQEMLGGIQCFALFVSYHSIARSHERRATALSIEVCDGEELAQLPQRLLEWIPDTNVSS